MKADRMNGLDTRIEEQGHSLYIDELMIKFSYPNGYQLVNLSVTFWWPNSQRKWSRVNVVDVSDEKPSPLGRLVFEHIPVYGDAERELHERLLAKLFAHICLHWLNTDVKKNPRALDRRGCIIASCRNPNEPSSQPIQP